MLAHALIERMQDHDRAKEQGKRKHALTDAVENARFQLEYARIFAAAGMADDSIRLLEPLFSPPSETSTFTVDLDPVFDGIRDEPEFVAMMERNR